MPGSPVMGSTLVLTLTLPPTVAIKSITQERVNAVLFGSEDFRIPKGGYSRN